ncbi:MAG: glutathione S-transferase family protein, partial [Arenimonas sp.]
GRLMLGLKDLAYGSVTIPRVMPKPDLVALTGGYRKTPVLQSGADIYCDTALIARRLEREKPSPPLFPAGLEAVAETLAQFADHDLFNHSVALNFQPEALASRFAGVPEEHVRAFAADRGALFSGGTLRRMDLAIARSQWPVVLGRLDAQLQARPFLLGDAASIADIAHYHPIWFVASSPLLVPLLAPYAALNAWMARIAAIGHGTPTPMSGADAVELARASEPEALVANGFVDPLGFDVGQAVTVAATDYGVDPVAGTLAWQDAEEIVIARDDERAGQVHVHFPRMGFRVAAA